MGHHDIKQYHVERNGLQHVDCNPAIRSCIGVIPFEFQQSRERVKKSLLVIDGKYGYHGFFHGVYLLKSSASRTATIICSILYGL